MASVYQRGTTWYVRYRDSRGRWRSQASTATNKTEARRLAGELERRAERQRLGLEPLPAEDGGGTLGELLEWWLETYSANAPSHAQNTSAIGKHLLSSQLASLTLAEVTSGHIETFLQERSTVLGPQSVNHLRRFLLSAFNRAKECGRWNGQNPAASVRRRKVPRRLADFLRVHEVPLVLAALLPHHRPIFAAAIYTGMRKGELIGLHKSDIDFGANLIMVQRSYDRDTTKGGCGAAIPIAKELVPYLKTAIKRSTSEYVFPGPEGGMMSSNNPLEEVLRRALGRAGIVKGYTHVCRKKGCGYSESAPDGDLRHCATHRHKLWPKAEVRPIRFHDLRHTTASLLLMSGANPAAVQKILRHSDPRITTEVYGHLVPGYLQEEVDRLKFETPSKESQPVATVGAGLVTSLLQAPSEPSENPDFDDLKPAESSEYLVARHARFEPATFGSGGQRSIQLS